MGSALLFLFLIIYLIVKAGSKTNKQQRPNQGPVIARQQAARPQAMPVRQPSPLSQTEEIIQEAPAEPEEMLPEAPVERARVMVHVSEHHHENMYEGSMGIAEHQGDPDAYDEMPSEHSAEMFVERPEEPAAQEGGLHLDFTASSLVNAVIMQEVLQRPRRRHF